MKTGIHPKLVKCIDEMMSDMTLLLYYYGEFCQFVVFEETERVPRCAVNVIPSGMVFYWNKKFLDITPQRHVNFIVVHEIFHLILDHPKRIRKGGFDMKLSNIATDMIINTAIKSDFIDTDAPTKNFIEVPTEKVKYFKDGKVVEDDHVWVVVVPQEYKGEHVFEEIYEWLKEEKQKFDEWKKDQVEDFFKNNTWEPPDDDGDGIDGDDGMGGDMDDMDGSGSGKDDKDGKKKDKKDGKGKDGKDDDGETKELKPSPNNGKKSGGCPVSDYLKGLFEGMDNGIEDWLDSHLPSEVPDEIRKSIVEDVKEHLRQRGFEKGKIKKTLDKLVKSKKDYLREIKTAISSIRGFFKVKTITKRNRRSIPGIKGKRKEGFGLNVILDTSGSMTGYHQRALSYIFQSNITINLILCDAEVQEQYGRSYLTIQSKSEFKKVNLSGFGGTTLQPGIDLINNTKELRGLNTLILTDGATDRLDVTKLRKCLILSVGTPCPIKAGNPRQIVVEDDVKPEKNW